MRTGPRRFISNTSISPCLYMECGGKRSATPLWIGNGTAGTAELRISRMARIRNGIGTAKAVPRPLALSPQSKGNSRDGRWRKTTKVAKSAKSEISGGASSVLPGLRIGIGQPNSPATDLPRGRAWFHGSRPLAESGRMGGEGVAKIQPFLCEPLWFSVVTGPRLWIGTASLTPSRQGAKGGQGENGST